MKKFLLLSGLAILALSGCSHDGNDNPAYAPEKNPNPKYFMTVKGNIGPALAKHYPLQFIASYVTNNPTCLYTVNSFEGISSPYSRSITFNAIPDDHGAYITKIPLDHFIPGKCQWSIQEIDYFMNKSGYSQIPIANFNINSNVVSDSKTLITEISCDQNANCNWLKFEYYNDNLNPNSNYYYQLNLVSS